MPRKWTQKIFYSKKLTDEPPKKSKAHSSSSSSSDDDSSSSSGSSSQSSHKSVDSSGAKIVKPIKLATLPNFDDSSDDDSSASEFGCGTYRKREDLSQSSSSGSSSSSSYSSSSEEDSQSSSSNDDSSQHSSSSEDESVPSLPAPKPTRPMGPRKSLSEPAFKADQLRKLIEDDDGKTKRSSTLNLFKKAVPSRFRKKKEKVDVLVPNKLDKYNPSTSSMGSRKSAGSSLPSKRGSDSEDDSSGDSQSSSQSSSSDDESSVESAKEPISKQPAVEKKAPRRATLDSAEKRPVIDIGKPRRRSTLSSAGSDAPEMKPTTTPTTTAPTTTPALYDEDEANRMLRRRSSTKPITADASNEGGGSPKKSKESTAAAPRTAKSSWGKLAKAVKRETKDSEVEDVFSTVLMQAKKRKEEKRRQSEGDDSEEVNVAPSISNANDVFLKVLQQAREKRGQSANGGDNGGGNTTIQSPFFNEGGANKSRFAAMIIKAAAEKKAAEQEDEAGSHSSESEEEFQAPKLVHQRPSMRHLFAKEEEEDEESSGSEEEAHVNSQNINNVMTEESEEESSSGSSEEGSLSTESSEEENVDESYNSSSYEEREVDVTVMSSDDDESDAESQDDEEDAMSAESQMSILTPIAEESVAPGNEDTDVDVDYAESSSLGEESVSASDLENDEDGDDPSKREEEDATPTRTSSAEGGLTGGEAMLTDMPDENDVALAKRKAVQNVMKDKSLSAIERNKMIQGVMAGRVELPKLPAKESQDPPPSVAENARNNATETGPTGGEAMLTGMADENDVALAKRKAVQNVMKDKSLSAVERNKMIQDVMAGRVELPKLPAKANQDSLVATIEITQNGAESKASSPKAENGKTKESPSRRRRKKSSKKTEPSNGVARTEQAPQESPKKNRQTSNSTVETFDSSGDVSNSSRHQKSVKSSCSLLDIDHNSSSASIKQHNKMFQSALSSAESSVEKTPDERALLTAMTFALHALDSQWSFDSFSTWRQSPSTKSKPVQSTLGKRERISPWSKHLVTDLELKICGTIFGDINSSPKSQIPKPIQCDALSISETSKSLNTSNRSSVIRKSMDYIAARPPKMPSSKLTTATFDPKKSAVIEKITQDLLLEPFSDDESDIDESTREAIKDPLIQKEIKMQRWIKSIGKLDPRWQIRKFFDDAAESFDNADIFTVWRPTSFDAVAKMMRGEGVGKGLDIKGKSAQRGDLSGKFTTLQVKNPYS
jgi:hypothetical protein